MEMRRCRRHKRSYLWLQRSAWQVWYSLSEDAGAMLLALRPHLYSSSATHSQPGVTSCTIRGAANGRSHPEESMIIRTLSNLVLPPVKLQITSVKSCPCPSVTLSLTIELTTNWRSQINSSSIYFTWRCVPCVMAVTNATGLGGGPVHRQERHSTFDSACIRNKVCL